MSNAERLNDVLEAIRLIEQIAASGKDAFLESKILQSAYYYNVIVVGEALSALDKATLTAHPDWRKFINYRHHLTHGYSNVGASRAWDHLQPLRQLAQEIREAQ